MIFPMLQFTKNKLKKHPDTLAEMPKLVITP